MTHFSSRRTGLKISGTASSLPPPKKTHQLEQRDDVATPSQDTQQKPSPTHGQTTSTATSPLKLAEVIMSIECYVCYEPLLQETQVAALSCGHVCCSPCLDNWLVTNREKSCPVCRYSPSFGAPVPGPVYIKFSGFGKGENPSSRTVMNLDGAIKNAGALKTLLDRGPSAEALAEGDFSTILEEAERLNSALKDLIRVRELQNVMSEISDRLKSIRSDIKQQRTVELDLQQRLKDQAETHRKHLEAERATQSKLLSEKGELEAKLTSAKNDKNTVIRQSEQGIQDLIAAAEKIKSIFEHSRDIEAAGRGPTTQRGRSWTTLPDRPAAVAPPRTPAGGAASFNNRPAGIGTDTSTPTGQAVGPCFSSITSHQASRPLRPTENTSSFLPSRTLSIQSPVGGSGSSSDGVAHSRILDLSMMSGEISPVLASSGYVTG